MLNKLQEAEKRFVQMEETLAEGSIFSDTERLSALMKDYKALTPIIEKYRAYRKVEDAHNEARLLSEDSLDAEMKELVFHEIKETKERMDVLLEELKILRLFRFLKVLLQGIFHIKPIDNQDPYQEHLKWILPQFFLKQRIQHDP